MLALKIVFWTSLVLLVWTHVAYPLAAGLAARLRRRRVDSSAIEPTVSIVVAAHNEEDVIERRVENLLDLDYPAGRLEIVVASDASIDRTDEIVERLGGEDERVKLVRCARAGKVSAQNRAVAESTGEIVAFSDANAVWERDALRNLVRSFADPDVAYVCGRASYEAADGTNREGAYWRFELWVRAQESRLGSVTGGNGLDLRGASRRLRRRRALVRPRPLAAVPDGAARPARRLRPGGGSRREADADIENEYRRKVRMFEHCWLIVFRGDVAPARPGLLRRDRLAPAPALRERDPPRRPARSTRARRARAGSTRRRWRCSSSGCCSRRGAAAAADPGAGLAYYYLVVTWATLAALAQLRPLGRAATWEPDEGTR